jgi:hypothetical protein
LSPYFWQLSWEAKIFSGKIWACFLAVLLMMVAGAAEPTRVVQAEEILKKIELGQPVAYNNVIVEGDLDLSGLNLTRVPVKRTWHEESLGLPNYEFIVSSPINISNSVVRGSVGLNVSSFQNEVIFFGTIFNEPAFLMGSRFNQTADFRKTKFNQTAYFGETRFNQLAGFRLAKFNQAVYFVFSQFNQIAIFQEARFNQAAYFLFSQFDQESRFEDARFSDFFSSDSKFSKEAFFDGAQINGILSLYRTKYDTFNIRWSSINDLAYDDTAYNLLIQNFNKLGFSEDAEECQYSYRCKHREELFRQHKFDSWLFDLLAWATYGYGLRPVRPLGWSFSFILIGGLFFFLTGSVARSKEGPSGKMLRALRRREDKPADAVSIWEALLLAATYFTSGASSIISATPTEFVPVGRARYVVVLLRLLGWIFFVIFLSSLTRTV